jgi:cytochrome P450
MTDSNTAPPQPQKRLGGKPGLPIIGNLVELSRDPLGFVTQLKLDHGDFAQFSTGMGNRSVLLSDPDSIERVLMETGKRYNKGDSGPASAQIFGNGLITSEGDFWKRQRKLSAPAFHHQSIKQHADLMVRYTQDMLSEWRDGDVRDIDHDMMLLTQRIIAKTLFDVDVKHDAKSAGDAFDAMMRGLGSEINGIDAILPALVPTPSRNETTKGVETINTLLTQIINTRKTSVGQHGDLLDMLMSARDEAGEGMSTQQLLDEIRTLYLAGHETTANTLTWTWLLLSQNPAALAAVEDEVSRVLAGRLPTSDDVRNLVYCDAMIKEALRVYPVAWVFIRAATEDVELSGYALPKGTVLWISPWVVHRDARWFDDPHAFKPERWLDESSKPRHKYAYLPFGGGPRVCIGNGFAMMESVLLLAAIVQQFRVAALPQLDFEIEAAGTIRPKKGLRAAVTRRKGLDQ